MDLDQYKLEITPDDGRELQQHKSVMRWDIKKKKYQPVMVGNDGKVIRNKGRRNEAGQKVTGEAVKTDIYAKWMKNKKNRIQGVGELESGAAERTFLESVSKKSVGGQKSNI